MSHFNKFLPRWSALAVVLIAVVYVLMPIYGFYSHRDKLPHLPFGWVDLPTEFPRNQILNDARFQSSANTALAALDRHRERINAPALSAAVAIDGARVWAGAVGWQDISAQIPATPKTRFRIGSTSKALTATTFARMLQRNLVDLDQPLADVYTELPNQDWASITPRQLASHTAGIAHYKRTKDLSGLYRFMALNKHFTNVEDAVSLFDDTPLLFGPGEAFSYSSLGTVLLSAYMQRAGEKSYQQLVSDLVLAPLNMNDTASDELSPRLATHYWSSKKRDLRRVREWRNVDLSHRLAAGGFNSTSSDLVKLGSAYVDASFLNAETVEKIWEPQRLSNGEVNEQNYAIGWRQGEFSENGLTTKTYHHGGVSRGAQSWLVVFPEHKLSIAINANINTQEFSDFAAVYREIANAFLDQH